MLIVFYSEFLRGRGVSRAGEIQTGVRLWTNRIDPSVRVIGEQFDLT